MLKLSNQKLERYKTFSNMKQIYTFMYRKKQPQSHIKVL